MMGQEFNENTLDTWASLFDEYKLNWSSFDREMFDHYKYLIHLRTNHPAFWMGELEFVPNSEDRVLSYTREYENSKFLIVVNLSADAVFVNFEKDTLSETINNRAKLIYSTGKVDRPSEEDPSELWIDGHETIILSQVL